MAAWGCPGEEPGEEGGRVGAVVLVRDTKDRDGGTLRFAPAAWQSFVALAKQAAPN
ncbi:DUF397 domain-containing protein [Micromonospora sp. NPDC047793]|uniref:DUF397 domain-containing protein n=1 Tax=unclassified Micromonospora TaxID=2617518 RepID=UPI001F488CB3|nr:DUF397 domain-containing protein [Verrucosispora sp. SN26_14.1]